MSLCHARSHRLIVSWPYRHPQHLSRDNHITYMPPRQTTPMKSSRACTPGPPLHCDFATLMGQTEMHCGCPQMWSPHRGAHCEMGSLTSLHAWHALDTTPTMSTAAPPYFYGTEYQLMYLKCTPEGRLVDPAGDILCYNWQKPQGCSRPHNNTKHACLDYGSTSHGTQKCPKVQPHSNTI